MEEHLVAIVSFEGALKREIKRIRELLKRDESLSSFRLDIEISGRVHDGDVNLAFVIGEQYASTNVRSATLSVAVDEFLRRRGWDQRNAPTAIGYEKIPSDNTDEIPFLRP